MFLSTGILHHALLAIFPDNNFTGILHHEMHAIFPGKHDDYTKSTKDWVILWLRLGHFIIQNHIYYQEQGDCRHGIVALQFSQAFASCIACHLPGYDFHRHLHFQCMPFFRMSRVTISQYNNHIQDTIRRGGSVGVWYFGALKPSF